MKRLEFIRLALGGAVGGLLGIAGNTGDAGADVNCQEIGGGPYTPPRRACMSGLPSSMIHIEAQKNTMYQDQWCWAACISMVFGYYGHPVSQSRIVREAYGQVINMPGSPAAILGSLNRKWVDDRGRSFKAESTHGVTNPVAAAQDLARNQPLILGTLGHAVVLTSLEYSAPYVQTQYGWQPGRVSIDTAVVRDPWPGRGRRVLSPQEWNSISFAAQVRVR